MNSLEQENIELKKRLEEAELAIIELSEIVESCERDYFIHVYNVIEHIRNKDGEILNPHPVLISCGNPQGKHEEFMIKASDVLCITCIGKVKTIRMKQPIENCKGEYRETDTIRVDTNESLEKFRHHIDKISYHLTQISRNTVVNLKYYKLKDKVVQISLEEFMSSDIVEFEITESHRENYITRKEIFDNLLSLQI